MLTINTFINWAGAGAVFYSGATSLRSFEQNLRVSFFNNKISLLLHQAAPWAYPTCRITPVIIPPPPPGRPCWASRRRRVCPPHLRPDPARPTTAPPRWIWPSSAGGPVQEPCCPPFCRHDGCRLAAVLAGVAAAALRSWTLFQVNGIGKILRKITGMYPLLFN